MAKQGTAPHIRDTFSPLQEIVTSVLRRFGDFAVSAIDGDTMTMFIDLANLTLEEINAHPYWTGDPLAYYTHPTEARPVPDLIMQNGLLFQYALQQASPKIELYSKVYYQSLNTLLWRRLNNGVGNLPIRARVMDGGSNKRYSPKTSPVTGQNIIQDTDVNS